jgi:predicted kinase
MTEPTSDPMRWKIARELRAEIESGQRRPGDKLPSSRAFAERYGVSVGTVNQAMEVLGREGLIASRDRSGRVVAARTENTPAARPRVVYVGGYSGSGKSEFGHALARLSKWAIFDKEALTRSVVDAALVQSGSTISDRESALYREVFEPAEYQCLAGSVSENVACGVSVIAIAPFQAQFSAATWFERQAATLAAAGADMSVVWVRCSTEAMRSNLTRRAAAADTWKLGHWDQYIASIDAEFVPTWAHTIVNNDVDDEPIQAQAKAFLLRLKNLTEA